jgi:hypothetical protein
MVQQDKKDLHKTRQVLETAGLEGMQNNDIKKVRPETAKVVNSR